jgi:hypothetical protein
MTFKYACHKCGIVGHRRKQCKNARAVVDKFNRFNFQRDVAVEEAVAAEEVGEEAVAAVEEVTEEQHYAEEQQEIVEEAAEEEEVNVEEKVEVKLVVCKWCGETTHKSKMCRRFKTRMCAFDNCHDGDCPYAHSIAELRESIWFHTEMCPYDTHTAHCRRTFAHSDEEKYNALSALIATRMSADLLI